MNGSPETIPRRGRVASDTTHNHAGDDEQDDGREHEGNRDYYVTNGSAAGFLHCAPLGTENATARGSPDPPPNVKKSFIRNHELTEISIGVLRETETPHERGFIQAAGQGLEP
ncbi:MAG: hypothetical protein E6G09_11600 [Actinobacteria bacterium]|nr:MAG: hypothetical protein E6G18_12670 [Actinomycetota bacterium]TML81902.1 MAG: hypothetical protein E6G09_11600 [Actinomycetota bacterium]